MNYAATFGLLALRLCRVVPLVFIWFLVVPYFFIVFYSVLELQSAARIATGSNIKLATYLVMARANQIADVEKRLDELKSERQAVEDEYEERSPALAGARDKLVDSLNMLIAVAGLPDANFTDCHTTLTTASAYESGRLFTCAREAIRLAMTPTPATSTLAATVVTDQEHQAAVREALATLKTNLGSYEKEVSDIAQTMERRYNIAAEYKPAVNAYKLLVGVPDSDASDPRLLDNPSLEIASFIAPANKPDPKPDPGADGASKPSPTATDSVGSVAVTFNSLSELPLFSRLFLLPPGAVVAIFTALMGAIGAGVYSLLQSVVRREMVPLQKSWVAYGSHPMLGAMAGFMVFFVVSAGTAFLVQPGASSASDAVNSLSPPALASLGVFAGIAAESALRWLNKKAEAFFEVTEDKPAGDTTVQHPAAAE